MNNKYYVLKANGEIVDPEKYLESSQCPENFKAFIEREALNKKVDPGLKSDYLSYAKRLGFDWEPNSDRGFARFDYKAQLIMRLVKEYARQLVNEIGFPIYEVRGANFFDMSYPVVQAYAGLYGDRLFQLDAGDKRLVMSYDASYPQFNLASKYQLREKHLPFAHFSISDCYRLEQSGECMLFVRQRRFFMPDLHPYFKNIDEAFQWYPKIEEKLLEAVKDIHRYYEVVIEVSSEENWHEYQKRIEGIAKNLNQDILVAIIRDGKDRYWIINVDYKIIDQLGQSREICCIQIDVGNASRLDIHYKDEKDQKHFPVIIHSAVPGGIERYLYMLFDNFKISFPLWLYPAQIRLIPINQKHIAFCKRLIEENNNLPVRIEIDDRDEHLNKRIKQAHEDLIPFIVVIGDKEMSSEANLKEFNNALNRVVENVKNKPFIPLSYPNLVSVQVK
jgi:threonyl-tRNA synthetase